MTEFKVIAQRLANAEDRFMAAVQEQFGKTEAEAAKILAVFKDHKIVKLDAITGQFTLSQGIFWDSVVMDNALEF